jgi:hypothetical protein
LDGTYTASCHTSAGRVLNPVFDYYEKVFGAVYSRPLQLKTEQNRIGELLPEILGILEVAEYLGCVHVIERPLDSQLAEFGHLLWISIMHKPIAWAELGVRIRSFSIIKEAIIHIAGLWHSFDTIGKESMFGLLRTVCERKAEELNEKKRVVEQFLCTYTPSHLKHEFQASNSVKEVGRTAYANDILDWIALAFWRQWLLIAMINGAGRSGSDGGMTLYACILNGGESYLNVNEVNQFHSIHAMTARGISRFSERLRNLKTQLKTIVDGLMESNLNLDLSRVPKKPDYLVCTEITKAEIQAVLGDDEMNLDWEAPAISRQLPELVSTDGSRNKERASVKRPRPTMEISENFTTGKASIHKCRYITV